MGTRPRLLDLFCGAGGASMGYHRAGFAVIGVDLHPQPRYPFAFIQADALAYLAAHGHEYDAIAASPPCQAYSEATPLHHRARLPRLIAPTRDGLTTTGKPYVIENVENARVELIEPIMLCGSMFALPVWRHRYFESPLPLGVPRPCDHCDRPVTLHAGSNTRKTTPTTPVPMVQRAMEIEWMTGKELNEAIPPVYTEWIGRQLIERL